MSPVYAVQVSHARGGHVLIPSFMYIYIFKSELKVSG